MRAPRRRQAPELAFLEIARLDALDQRLAQFGLGADRQQFQAGGAAPHFAQQGGVDALRLLVAARQQEAGEPLVDVGLLVAIEAAGHASPEDPPVDFALHLVAVRQAGGVNAARLLDAEIVAGIAEAGTQAEAGEIEPADLVRRALLAPVGRGEERVGHLPDGGERPTVPAQPHGLFELRREFLGRDRAISPTARRPLRSAPATLSAPAR